MRYRLPIYLIFALALLLSLPFPGSNSNKPVYQCPPCGCTQDHVLYDQPGHCPQCEMELFKVETSYQGLVNITGPLLGDNYTTLHYKLIYPAFIIGIMLGILSLIRINGKPFNPFLGGILLIISLYGFKNQLYGVDYGISSNFRFLFTPISFILLIGPLTYFYIKSVTESFVWKNSYLFHFIPAAIMFMAYSVLLISPDEVKVANMITPFEPFFGHTEQITTIVLVLVYLYFSTDMLADFRVQSKDHLKVVWLNKFYLLIFGLTFVWLLLVILNYKVYGMGVATLTYNPLWVSISLIIYWVTIEVLLNPKQFFQSFTTATNGYPAEKLERDKELLLRMMEEEHPFLDPGLSLDKLANQLEMNPKYLSLVLNNGFNKNFYEFINEYRIEKVKDLLVDPGFKHLTIAAIANEAGFNSKSSFNSIFKKYTNSTPKEFLRQQKTVEE